MSYGRISNSMMLTKKKSSSSSSSSSTWSSSTISSNPRLRRRRASTGEAFGKRGVVPSSSLSFSGSPTCVRAFSSIGTPNPATTFEEAYQQGTVLPYFLDTAAKSLDFSDLAFRSYSAVTGSKQLLQSRQEDVSGGVGGCDSTQPLLAIQDDDHRAAQQPYSQPRRRRRCKSLNDLRIHHDRNIEAIEIECPPHRNSDDTNEDTTTAAADDDRDLFWRSSTRQQHTQHFQCVDEDEEYDDYNDYDEGYAPIITPHLTMSNDASRSDSSLSVDSSARSSTNTAPPPSGEPVRDRAMSGSSVSSTGSRGTSGGSSSKSLENKAAKAAAGAARPGGSSSTTTAHENMLLVNVQYPGADRTALKELPALRDAPPAKREELFVLKLKLCSVIFSFEDPMADKRGKDMKRQTLLELVDYVNTPAGQKIFTESIMGDLMMMVSSNVCRALPPATDDFDPEEDEPVLEPAWPHLQVAYEFFLRYIVSSEVNAKAAKKYVDQKFCLQLVELFDSEDPRERDYLKTILHRIYGKFMSHRSFIRRAISNVFYRFVYETERHNGIGELLEILGSIINGFAIPLKKEHLQFLVRALIPLHKPKCVALYHQQLSYCIIQYVEKDADTATPILNGFFKCWPWSSSGKQVMFLNELEEILELLGADQLSQVSDMLFTNLARCLDSDHFQVVERALFLWNNEHLVNSGCLSRLNAQAVLPIIYGPLYKNSSGHWNATVEGLAQNVLKMYMEYDLVLYDRCTANYFREEEDAKRKLQALEERWSAIEHTASTNTPAIMVE